MINVPVVDFIPPIVGTEGKFNTFRLGGGVLKRIAAGDTVFLLDKKLNVVFGRAKVLTLEVGTLGEMCLLHAAQNHTEVVLNDPNNAPERLFKYIQKIYGPHIAPVGKKTVVLYMERIE